jgi:hypothetical protein
MTYQVLIEILQTCFANHLDDEVVIQDKYHFLREYAPEYLEEAFPHVVHGKLVLQDYSKPKE